jgi:predicted membrane protein
MDKEEWRRQKWEARLQRRAMVRHVHSPYRGALLGTLIIAAGVFLLLNNMGLVQFRDIWDFAPLVFVLVGAIRLIEAEGRPIGTIFGALLAGIGGLWFASNMDWLRIDHRLIVPIIIMAVGAMFLVRSIERQRDVASAPQGPACAGTVGEYSVLHDWALFGGVKRRVTSQTFQGGELMAMFGGVEIDLRGAALGREEVLIDASAMFGGVEIRVPATWTVVVKGTGVFGGYEDKTLPPSNPPANPQRLVINGIAMFGGVVVGN